MKLTFRLTSALNSTPLSLLWQVAELDLTMLVWLQGSDPSMMYDDAPNTEQYLTLARHLDSDSS